jgi:hypothetical protein
VLNRNASNCKITSVGPVEDHGEQNTITLIKPPKTSRTDAGE